MDIYEKKYKEALGWMQSLYSSLHGAILEDAEHYFPELKESEDERISREITDFICWATDRGCITKEQVEKSNSWLAWLEKQGRVKESTISQHENKTCKENDNSLTSEDERTRKDILEWLKSIEGQSIPIDKYNSAIAWLGKQASPVLSNSSDVGKDEQKPADKVEPKFKIGDKIRRKTPSSCDKDMQVTRIEKDYYICNHIGKLSSEVVSFSKQSSYELIEPTPAAWSEEDE